ncbi:MAG: hypothetical protein AAGF94_01680 [Pseudomonadota bacterium]
MRKINEENERIKRAYLIFLREAKGQDESSLDKVAAALLDFETAISFRSFKAFHREWATKFKTHLTKRKNMRTGKPLGVTTRDATLRLVKAFIEWLSTQPGYKSRISYADARPTSITMPAKPARRISPDLRNILRWLNARMPSD